MKILVTGAADFIGFHTIKKLLERGDDVVGLDSLNNYYDVVLKKKAKKKFLPLQKEDVPKTLSDISRIKKDLNYNPKTSVEVGVKNFINWYLNFYKK